MLDYSQLDYILFLVCSMTTIMLISYIFNKKFQVNIFNKKIIFLTFLICSIGYLWVNHQGEKVWNNQINQLKTMMPTYADAIKELGHESISSQTPESDPKYLILIEQQKKWLSLNSQLNDIYTLKTIGTENVLVVDSETDYDHNGKYEGDREARTNIAEPYDKMYNEIAETYKGKIVHTNIPYKDKWGNWVSVLAPIYNDKNEIDAVIGVDYSAEILLLEKYKTRMIYICYLIGILAITYIFNISNAFLKREIYQKNIIAKELLIAQEQQIKTEKFSVLGKMSAGIAHEINNPLAIISGNAALIVTELKKNEIDFKKIDLLAKKIEKTADRIAKIIKGLKTFSRTSQQDPHQVFSLENCIKETLDLCSERLKNHGIKIDVSIPEHSHRFEVYGTSVQISQVLLNLINNSFDAITNLNEKWIRISLDQNVDFYQVKVTDSGLGIPSNVQNNLMQPFFTTKDIGKGTGLGLSISKGILENHKGELIYDKSSINTTFILKLPIHHKLRDVA